MIAVTRAYITDIKGNMVGSCEKPVAGLIAIELTREVTSPLRVHFDIDGHQDVLACMVVTEGKPFKGDTINYRAEEVCPAIISALQSRQAPRGPSDLRRRGSNR